eukprot:CAMPEP_0184650182 /NCGR_PEP_ID=MMETSP0308-20130426/7707_1 /TAXON_ID=38269 /ORGANISM="Gloeochaete witrockiana, Strain SAG 46.84" /LENGTH=664 /DNA_ID=CAMNT_0027083533 /DNA_START=102 /DNA_END=2096 /DNA_ORIENTATION=+
MSGFENREYMPRRFLDGFDELDRPLFDCSEACSPLLSMPDDVLCMEIFRRLDPVRDWCSVSLVCQRFAALIVSMPISTLAFDREWRQTLKMPLSDSNDEWDSSLLPFDMHIAPPTLPSMRLISALCGLTSLRLSCMVLPESWEALSCLKFPFLESLAIGPVAGVTLSSWDAIEVEADCHLSSSSQAPLFFRPDGVYPCVSGQQLRRLCGNAPRLRSLRLAYAYCISETDLGRVLCSVTALEELSLVNLRFSPLSSSCLLMCTRLKRLNIRPYRLYEAFPLFRLLNRCRALEDVSLYDFEVEDGTSSDVGSKVEAGAGAGEGAGAGTASLGLQRLDLHRCMISLVDLLHIGRMCPVLRELNLSMVGGFHNFGVAPGTSSAIRTDRRGGWLRCFPALEVLSLTGDMDASTMGFLGAHNADRYCSRLRSLELRGGRSDARPRFSALSNNLVHLCVDGLTDSGLLSVAQSCRVLTSLQCVGRKQWGLSDSGIATAAPFLSTGLVSLVLKDCCRVGDEAAGAIARHLPRLHTLTLECTAGGGGANCLTDAGVLALAASLHSLRVLSMHGCSHVTSIRRLAHANPCLTRLNLEGIVLSEEECLLLCNNAQSLQELVIEGPYLDRTVAAIASRCRSLRFLRLCNSMCSRAGITSALLLNRNLLAVILSPHD